MSIIINTNISSMLGITALNKNTNSVNKALERLSTGYRINSSKDDAAGCAISMSLNKDISSLAVAQENAQMGKSLIDTANSSLSNISSLLQRMRDLAEQSANGTYGADERSSMQTEMEGLQTELYRIKNTTEFNGKQIFGTEEVTRVTEAEAVEQGYTVVKTAQELKAALRTNDSSCKVMLFADINLDDLGVDETGSNWEAVGTASNSFKGTFDGNGFTISNLKINKSSSDNQGLFGHITDATIMNVYMKNVHVIANHNVGGLVGYSSSSKITNCKIYGDIKGMGNYIGGFVGVNINQSTIENCNSNVNVIGNGNYCAAGFAGVNENGSIIINCSSNGNMSGTCAYVNGFVGINYSNSTITKCISTGNITGAYASAGFGGYNSGIITNCSTTCILLSTTNNSYGAFLGVSSSGRLEGNEYNSEINNGVQPVGRGLNNPTDKQILDNKELTASEMEKKYRGESSTEFNLQVGINDDEHSSISVDTGFELGSFAINISTEKGARAAIDKIDKLISKIYTKQTELGAVSNRLTSSMEYQSIQKSANIATNSVVKDADYAKESSNYIKSQILQNTTASLLSTANQNPNIALMLLNNKKH